MADFVDFKPNAAPAPVAAPKTPTAPVKQVGIRDYAGEVWPLNSNMGRMLENTALQNGMKPAYIDLSTSPSMKNITESGGIHVVPREQRADKSEHSAFMQQGLTPVKEMQQALINLSKDIASHNIQNVADRQTAKGETLTGSDPFMNFLVNQYMNKSKTSGQQLVNTDEKQPVRMDTAKTNDNFKGILHTLTRIGTPGAEQRPDGNWGPRTNNALKQVYSLATALTQVQKDMGLTSSEYTDADLADLYSNIPEDIAKTNINEKVAKAGVIAKNLNKLRNLYDAFRSKVLDNPSFSAQISQEKPLFVKKTEQPANALNDYEKRLYEQHKDAPINISLNGHQVVITPANLHNIESFKQFLSSKKEVLSPEEAEAVNKNDQKMLNKMLIQVANSLGGE